LVSAFSSLKRPGSPRGSYGLSLAGGRLLVVLVRDEQALRDLLRDGRAPRSFSPGLRILSTTALKHAEDVDTGVLVEALILAAMKALNNRGGT